MTARDEPTRSQALGILIAYGLIWIATAIAPRDFFTWLLENIPVFVFMSVLVATWRRFTFTNLSYLLMAIFMALHAVGARTGYAHSPVGDVMKDLFGLHRNCFDRAVHFAFGLLFAYPAREFLLRTSALTRRGAGWYAVCLVMAVSSLFEVGEAFLAETISPGTGPDWLGAQGDEWDAQFDLLMALAGAMVAMIVLWLSERKTARERAPA